MSSTLLDTLPAFENLYFKCLSSNVIYAGIQNIKEENIK
jgi:hypothetical protein